MNNGERDGTRTRGLRRDGPAIFYLESMIFDILPPQIAASGGQRKYQLQLKHQPSHLRRIFTCPYLWWIRSAQSRACVAGLGTMRAHLIMAWLQPQSTRERPDTSTQTASDSSSKHLATPGRTIHFLTGHPARRLCRGSVLRPASSAGYSIPKTV